MSTLPRLLLLCSIFLVQACAPTAPPATAPAQVDVEDLLQRIRFEASQFQSLRGLAKVKVQSPQRSFSASQVLLANKPDRLRAETLSLFGSPVVLLASDGKQFQVLVPGQRRFYQGPASDRNLQRFAHLPMRLVDLVHLLLYQVPLLPDVMRMEASSPGPKLLLSGPNGQEQELQFDSRLQLLRCRLLRGGRTWLDVEYSDFSAEDQFPRQMSLQLPLQDVNLTVDFQNLEINPQLDSQRFVLSQPDGVQLIELPGD